MEHTLFELIFWILAIGFGTFLGHVLNRWTN